jgi:hypothetical protein
MKIVKTMPKLKGKKPHRNITTKVQRPRRIPVQKVPRHGFEPAANMACVHVIEDFEVPNPVRDFAAVLLARSIRRQRST